MVVDSSALVAIALDEPAADRLIDALAGASVRLMAAPNKLESLLVLIARIGPEAGRNVAQLIDALKITIEPFDDRHAEIAAEAYVHFGKGRGHGAALNYGDCMAYALAKASDLPLLYLGADFAKTDVVPAL